MRLTGRTRGAGETDRGRIGGRWGAETSCDATSARSIRERPARGSWCSTTTGARCRAIRSSTTRSCRSPAANFIIEAIGTAVLLFGILAIAANAQTLSRPGDVDLSFVFSRGLQPLLVGVLVLGIGLSLGGPTGYAINPARDLGPRIAHALLPIPGKGSSDWGYSWIPVVAPIVGGAFGAGAYFLIGF